MSLDLVYPDRDLAEDQAEFALRIRSFAAERLEPHARRIDEECEFRHQTVLDLAAANIATPCSDLAAPDGGYSFIPGTDCNDEDATEFPGRLWYADCDGDTFERAASVSACDLAGANAATPCSDLAAPDGGWTSVIGTDCDDEDAAEFPGQSWYADCDNDTHHKSVAIVQCASPILPTTDCADLGAPDGGWSNVAGASVETGLGEAICLMEVGPGR